MKTGTVKRFVELRGFGFILGEGGKELFFHIRDRVDMYRDDTKESGRNFGALRARRDGRTPQTGDSINYEEIKTEQGWRADTWGFADTLLMPKASPARTTSLEASLTGFLNQNLVQCPHGCGNTIRETDEFHHGEYGCKIAIAMGRG